MRAVLLLLLLHSPEEIPAAAPVAPVVEAPDAGPSAIPFPQIIRTARDTTP